jgi:hypothetical protein
MSENLLLVISIVLVLVCYLVLHALLLRVREKTCVSDNRVLAACQERTMYHQLTVEAPATMSRPEQFCLNLLFPCARVPPPHPSKRICPVPQEGSR